MNRQPKVRRSEGGTNAHMEKMRASRKIELMRHSAPTYGVRMAVENMKPGFFATLDCGCLVKLIRPHETDSSVTPMCVMDNSECTCVHEEEPPLLYGDEENGIYGTWRVGWKGSKIHHPGSAIQDNGLWHGVMHETSEIHKRFKRELENETKQPND